MSDGRSYVIFPATDEVRQTVDDVADSIREHGEDDKEKDSLSEVVPFGDDVKKLVHDYFFTRRISREADRNAIDFGCTA